MNQAPVMNPSTIVKTICDYINAINILITSLAIINLDVLSLVLWSFLIQMTLSMQE
jgi:hypothetical protein